MTIADLIATRRPAHALPTDFVIRDDVFAADLEAVFGREWIFAGPEVLVKQPGDWVTLEIGRASVIIVRGRDGLVRAFHNVCRHRGARFCSPGQGHSAAFSCPYHQWTYGLDGQLRSARLMGDGFRREDHGLLPVHVAVLSGLMFICLARHAPSLDTARATFAAYLEPHGLPRTKVAAFETYRIKANWKIAVENNRECYHCAVCHPEFMISNFDAGMPGDPRSPPEFAEAMSRAAPVWDAMGLPHRAVNFPDGAQFRMSRLPLREGYLTESLDGSLVSSKLIGAIEQPHAGALRMTWLPNGWGHAMSDHATYIRILPRSVGETDCVAWWLVHEDAVEGVDYDVSRIKAMWDATAAQDAHLCEITQAGMASPAFVPGPYSPVMESSVLHFDEWYLAHLKPPREPLAEAAE